MIYIFRVLPLIFIFASLFILAVLMGPTQKKEIDMKDHYKSAIFAGGCFWCMEPPYDKLDGVVGTISGYSGGHKDNPTYEEVTSGTTGHVEVLKVVYDPEKVTYQQLLDTFWPNVDPFDDGGQFCDRGETYVSAIFYGNDVEKKLAEASLKAVEKKLGKPVKTKIRKAETFWEAEDYHQDYYRRDPFRYKYYRSSCGRDQKLKEIWGE